MTFTESTLPCYPGGIAHETARYRVVFYEYSTSGGVITRRNHWRAYKLPSGNYVNGPEEYNTKDEAITACLTHEVKP